MADFGGDNDRPMDGRETSAFCARKGLPIAVSTLSTMRSRGSGPTFLKYGRRVYYRPSAVNRWLDSRVEELRQTQKASRKTSGAS